MITVKAMSEAINQNAARVTAYRSGGTGKDGTCDCIGLIMGALSSLGYKWPGKHGTNWTARNSVIKNKTSNLPQALHEGMVVLKYRNPGDTGYDAETVQKYINSGSSDKRDYYHIGYVLSSNPLHIIHCTSPGPIVHDSKIGKWRVGADLSMVDYSGIPNDNTEVVVNMTAIISSENGKGANLRKSMSTSSALLDRIPEGAEVEVLEAKGEWTQVTYRQYTGYVMSKFLIIDGEPTEEPIDEDDGTVMLELDRDTLLKIYEACAIALGLGVG